MFSKILLEKTFLILLTNFFLGEFEATPCQPDTEKTVGCKYCTCMKRGLGYLCSRQTSTENCRLTNGRHDFKNKFG